MSRIVVAVLVLVLVTLAGCTLSREKVRRATDVIVAARDESKNCSRADACAIASPYHDLYRRAIADSTADAPVHYANLLDIGADALLLRVHLIRAARRSIDVQTFIFTEDDAGYLTLDELIKAARRGVRVRVIADQLFSLDDATLLARLATAHENFEIRLYNPTFDEAATQPLEFAANLLCCFFKFNQRMHNKLLLVDEAIGIAGGRNYEDRYFDWDEGFDYRDRDVLVTGPAGQAMERSFEQFWRHRRTVPLARLKDVNRRVLSSKGPPAAWTTPVYKAPERVAALSALADDGDAIRQRFAKHVFRVGRVDYFSDSPNKPLEPHNRADQELTRRIIGMLRNARHEIVMQTPYLVISRRARKVFRQLRETRPELRVIVSTNSLASTDAFYVYAMSHKYKKRYLKAMGFEIFELKPFPEDAAGMIAGYAQLAGGPVGEDPERGRGFRRYGRAPLDDGANRVRVGLHAKSIVIDAKLTMIGSHNFDPRSDNYNTESGFIIHDAAFADAVRDSILRDAEPHNSWTIAKRIRPRIIDTVNAPIAEISTALPLFDLWPFRYATSYELNPGCEPLPATDEKFYECYTAVGDFPGVDLPLKLIYTRIVTAFGAGLVGIL